MSPPTRRSGPNGTASHRTPARESEHHNSTPPPADPEYDLAVGDASGYTSDPLTADEWAAVCMAEARDLAEVVDADVR